MVVLLAPHPRKNSRSFRVIARGLQSLPLTLLTHHLLSITSGKVEGVRFWAVLLGFFAEGLVSVLDLLAGYGLGHIDLTFHREEIRRSLLWSVMGAHSSSSQVTSNVGSAWSIIGADEIFWDNQIDRSLVWMKRMMARNLRWVVTLDTEIFFSFHPKPPEMFGLGLPLKGFLFPSIF